MEKTKIKGLEVNVKQVWSCKIGFVDAEKLYGLPGCDGPMREAVAMAFQLLFNRTPEFIFSGWNTDLTQLELECLKKK